jgi:hypothetical protein
MARFIVSLAVKARRACIGDDFVRLNVDQQTAAVAE